MDEVVKPTKKKHIDNHDNDEPLTFSISAFKKPSTSKPKCSPLPPVKPSFSPSPLSFGDDFGSDLGGMGPIVPTLGPKKEPTRVEKLRAAEEQRLKEKNKDKPENEDETGEGSSPTKSAPIHQDFLAMDYLYKTKTKSELNFLKRQIEKDRESDTTEKRAKLSHKQNIEKYNSYLAAIPEQNELRRINWHKH